MKDTIIRMIDLFTELYPDASFRGGHLTLDDYNLYDGHIKYCIKCIDAGEVVDDRKEEDKMYFDFVTGQMIKGENPNVSRCVYEQNDELRECDKATRAFLEFLLSIPEEIREEHADAYFDDAIALLPKHKDENR